MPRRGNAPDRAELILNTTKEHSFNATFAPAAPPPGNVGFVTQSGALGLALIDLASDRSLGVSSFASIGNRADVTANDILEYWEGDEATEVALLYIEFAGSDGTLAIDTRIRVRAAPPARPWPRTWT
jgi:acyl-CoA synthetase (NDP forming)